MGQRGSIRQESGSYYGYYNTCQWEEKDGELTEVRKQKCVKLGPAQGLQKLSKWDAEQTLAKEIEKAQGGTLARGLVEELSQLSDSDLAKKVLWIACGDIRESGKWFGLCH
jgi:hypothetical protein